jgi:hypothetical protein
MKAANAKQRTWKDYSVYGLIIIVAVLVYLIFPANVFAGLILGAELRFTYEDNVVGLLSDQRGQGQNIGITPMMLQGMGGGPNKNRYTGSGSGSTASPADFYATVSAEAGGYKDLGTDASVFAKGFANHSSYNTYTDLDATIGGVSTGVVLSATDGITAGATLVGKVKRFGDSQRNSTAYGGTLSLKEKLLPSFWLREFGEYEQNNADTAFFSYTGTKIGIGAGYSPLQKTLLTAGYSYLVQKFKEPSGFEIKTNTVFLSADQVIVKVWSVAAEYDLQVSKETITGSSTTDNIFSLALKYSY